MKRRDELKNVGGLLLPILLLSMSSPLSAQRPQDNWYLESTWIKDMAVNDGGLSSPYGVAIGPDQRIYVGDEGSGRVNVYLPDGTFSFAITNGFGGGEAFSQPRGMVTDGTGNLYVADYGSNCVFVFTASGEFVRKIGGTLGTGDGQLSGVIDVGLGSDAEVYVLEQVNCRVSVFTGNGAFLRTWGAPGLLAGQLRNPISLAVSPSDRVLICDNGWGRDAQGIRGAESLKQFDRNGILLSSWDTFETGDACYAYCYFGGAAVRVDPGGYPHVLISAFEDISSGGWVDYMPRLKVYGNDGSVLAQNAPASPVGGKADFRSPCVALGPDGTMVLCATSSKRLSVFRMALRDQFAVPRNAIPIPAVTAVTQRPSSPLVDVDYQVTDADDSTVHAAMLIFKNAIQTLSNCIPRLTLVEGTATNLGLGIAANQTHRVTWNAGADWSVNLGDFHVTILARDSRPGLLDIHYVNLPADRGMPALKISRSPLVEGDFMQVWWWLLATNDVAVTLSSNRIYGVNGAYAAKVLCEDTSTTSDGRAYVYEKMGVREATPEEMDWAKHGSTATTINQWPPVRTVGGRPAAVNEYGFDTGNWNPETSRWVVPLN